MQSLLPLALLLELLALLTRFTPLSWLSAGLLGLFFIWHWRSLLPYPRKLALVTLATLAYWLWQRQPDLAQMGKLAASAAYYSAFVGALGVMHCLVVRLPQLGELHRLLLAGPKATLYPSYLLSSCAISALISFGMLSLMCGSLETYVKRMGITGRRRFHGMRGVMTAALRGWALVPLLAPTSVSVAILTREIPSLSWGTLLPYSALAALVMLLAGWWPETRRLHLLRKTPSSTQEHSPPGASFNILLLVSALGIGLIALVANLTWLSATQAAMLLVPLSVVVVLLVQTRSPKQSLREVNDALCGMRNETFIFGCSALLAGLIGSLIPIAPLAALLGTTPTALFVCSSIAMLGMLLSTLLGVAPIISISLCAAILSQLAEQGVSPLGPAVALLCGFALAMLISPYGASALMLSRYSGLSPWRVAVTWNGRFVLLALVPMLLIPLLA